MYLIAVNYHYVGDDEENAKGIYPTSPVRLSHQLDELGKQFEFIGEKALLKAIEGKVALPAKSCIITFDDGLRGQYDYAVPILEKKKIPAIFFINTQPLSTNKGCQPHKIHFLLANLPIRDIIHDVAMQYKKITGLELDLNGIKLDLAKRENPHDTDHDTLLLKYLLNSHLDQILASNIVDILFKKIVKDEKEFCQDAYLSKDQLVTISKNELFSIGLHSSSHLNITHSGKEETLKDFEDNFMFLKNELNIKNVNGISYPVGMISLNDFKEKLEDYILELEIRYGFTMTRGINENFDSPLLLKRFDTNDVIGGKAPKYYFN